MKNIMINNKLISVFFTSLLTLFTLNLTGCNQKTVTETSSKDDVVTPNEKEAVSVRPSLNTYYTGKDKCHISIPETLIYADKGKVDRQLNTTVLTFFTMMSGRSDDSEEFVRDKETAFKEMRNAIDRGCDVNEHYENQRALEMALLHTSPEAFKFLMDNGANPLEKIENVNKKIDGLNLFEVAELLAQKEKVDKNMKAMIQLVLSYKDKFKDSPKVDDQTVSN